MLVEMLSNSALADHEFRKVWLKSGGALDVICDVSLFGPRCIDKPPGPRGVQPFQPLFDLQPIKKVSTPPGPSSAAPS